MSVPIRASQAAGWTGGRLVRGVAEARFDGASIDTRAIESGQLFVAIVGPNFDAHEFLGVAVAAGAAGLMVEREGTVPGDLPPDLPVIEVADTTRALGALARGHRAGFGGPVVAITGSNGKTSTKEMCASILSIDAPCLKNEGNLNNQFGLPLTLLRRDADHRTAVVELGMNHRGEIAELVAIAQPTVGVITNVGTAHIEHLGSRDEIALEKGDLVAGLPASATAVLNADDPRVAAQAGRTAAGLLRYGTGAGVDVRAENAERFDDRGYRFDLTTPAGRSEIRVIGLGETAWMNALAAAAGAFATGVSLETIAAGLAAYQPIDGRLVRIALRGGGALIDDSYNANPQSMEIALRLLSERAARGRSIAVIGDMGELGNTADTAHRELGRTAGDLCIDFLFALGDRADAVAAGAIEGGMSPDHIHIGRDHEDVASRVMELVASGDWVLVKGSRAMKMERVVELLAEQTNTARETA
ncbi:MAG: UDP-N-acetylmuramoyl-tripeptide--D-alanyl-D-alanine ligase [Myxococcota bacterium]